MVVPLGLGKFPDNSHDQRLPNEASWDQEYTLQTVHTLHTVQCTQCTQWEVCPNCQAMLCWDEQLIKCLMTDDG